MVVKFSFRTIGGEKTTLRDLVTEEKVACGSHCEVSRRLSASAVFIATPSTATTTTVVP